MTTQLMIPAKALLVKETEAFTALTFSTRATLLTLSQHNHVPEELYKEAEQLGLTPNGPIQYIYTGASGDETRQFGLEIVLPVAATNNVTPFGFVFQTFLPMRCVSYIHRGSWEEFPAMYDALFATFNRAGYTYDGRVREVYGVVDFDNPRNHVTEIQVGLV